MDSGIWQPPLNLELEHDVGLRHRAAQQRATVRRPVHRLDGGGEVAVDDRAFAIVADARPARPANRYVASLRELEQAREPRAPRDRQAAPHEADAWPLADG